MEAVSFTLLLMAFLMKEAGEHGPGWSQCGQKPQEDRLPGLAVSLKAEAGIDFRDCSSCQAGGRPGWHQRRPPSETGGGGHRPRLSPAPVSMTWVWWEMCAGSSTPMTPLWEQSLGSEAAEPLGPAVILDSCD